MKQSSQGGFTLVEVLFSLLIGAVLVLIAVQVADLVSRANAAMRHGADSRLLQATTERVLRRALQEAGAGMPAAANLSGVGVSVADAADGTPADTLVTLRADGDAVAVAARPCRVASPSCVAVVGDHRSRFPPGGLMVVGTRGLGLRALQVVDAPAVFAAPCAGDCPERLVCPLVPLPTGYVNRVVGSVRHPGATASSAPCAQPFGADGSRCEEVAQTTALPQRQAPVCHVQGATSMFTELRVADRTVQLGYPAVGAALTRGGASASPRVRAVPIVAARFWVRAGPGTDTSLVRQNGISVEGSWRTPVPIATPVHGFRVETSHGATAWARGIGIFDDELTPDPGNPNYVWRATPVAAGTNPAAWFARGHHTISAVRIQYVYHAVTAQGVKERREAWMITPTRSLLAGGTGDVH